MFQLIDLDRTIFDTSRFAKAITDEIDITEPTVGTKLDEQFEAAYKNEETFFLLRTLRQERGDAWFEALVERVVKKIGATSLILAGVEERLSVVNDVSSLRPSWGILTYGDEIDQRMKLRLIGMEDIPYYLTKTPNKAEVIASWKNPDGTFTLPKEFGGEVVDSLTLEDDKLRAFIGLPEGVRGFWVTSDPAATRRLSEVVGEKASSSITPVEDVSEVVAYLLEK